MSICGNIPILSTPEAPFPHTYSSTNLKGTIILIFFVVLLSIYKFLNLRSLKFFLLSDFLTLYMFVSCFFHLSVTFFCTLLCSVSDAYMRKCSGYIPRSRIARLIEYISSNLSDNAKLVSKVVTSICTLTSSIWEFCCFTSLPTVDIVRTLLPIWWVCSGLLFVVLIYI